MPKSIIVLVFALSLAFQGIGGKSTVGGKGTLGGGPVTVTAPTLDQSGSNVCSSACSGTPQVVSVSFTATAGTHMFVEGHWCDNSGCSNAVASTDITANGGGISDLSNTFLTEYIDVTSNVDQGMYLFEVTSATGGTHTITLTFDSTLTTVNYASILVSSWTGLVSGEAADQHGAASTTAANGSCPTSGNLAQSNELVLGFLSTSNAVTQGAGFSLLNSPGNNHDTDEYLVGGTLGSTETATFVHTTGTYICEITTFKHQ